MPQQIKVEHLAKIMDYIEANGAITNRKCREVTKLSYDTAIKIFRGLCILGMVRKEGASSGTKYVKTEPSNYPQQKRPGFHRKETP